MYIDDRAYLTPPDNDSQSCAAGGRNSRAANRKKYRVMRTGVSRTTIFLTGSSVPCPVGDEGVLANRKRRRELQAGAPQGDNAFDRGKLEQNMEDR